MNQDLKSEALTLLKQFRQIILSGPPGTGKTRAALNVAASILGKTDAKIMSNEGYSCFEDDPRFAFVQFHPSYNYEDFVRGIRVKTKGGQVVYETENRIFGKMAERAAEHSDEKHVLVIDEINRANVSAVLGELIYGLEYRGKAVQTPYAIDGNAELTVPSNLRVIGTMNTADRTIGQIDYAVRRRFAFVHCPPDESVVESDGGARALVFFKMVDDIFAHLSAGHDKEDVCIGHSYFLADGAELANKIIYQVVPILREYLKDGILKKEAEDKIEEIQNKARALLNDDRAISTGSAASPSSGQSEDEQGKPKWRWVHVDSGTITTPDSLRKSILLLVRHYAKTNKCQNIDELAAAFPAPLRPGLCVVASIDGKVIRRDKEQHPNPANSRFFRREKQQIHLEDGSIAVVCGEWGAEKTEKKAFENMEAHVNELGYKIYRAGKDAIRSPYWYVNIGHQENARVTHRAWKHCQQYGFVAGGQDDNPDSHHSAASQLKKIPLGATVFAYRSNFGYLGCGIVTREATPIMGFLVDDTAKKLGEVLDAARARGGYAPEKEFAVGVDWLSADKSPQPGVLMWCAYPNTASPIHDDERLRELKRNFTIVVENDDTH